MKMLLKEMAKIFYGDAFISNGEVFFPPRTSLEKSEFIHWNPYFS